jgi:hypothetical protein
VQSKGLAEFKADGICSVKGKTVNIN